MSDNTKETSSNRPHFIKALGWSLAGLVAAFRHETAFRQEAFFFCILAPLSLILGESGVEKALLLGSLILILIAELLNSAVETAVDRIGTERHPLAGRAKDMASAAVFLAILNAGAVWGIVLWG